MKQVVAAVAVAVGAGSFWVGTATATKVPAGMNPPGTGSVHSIAATPRSPIGARGVTTAALTDVVHSYCGGCHNDDAATRKGNLTLVDYNVDAATDRLANSERMILKLRAAMMPPPGARRPGGDTLIALVETLEQIIDKAAKPNAGLRTFQRMNRHEYTAAIHDILGLDVDAGDWLPLDQMSANFDNIGDVQAISPTLLESYMTAADAISRLAVGDRNAPNIVQNYRNSAYSSQHPWDHVEGSPFGTHGGMVVTHTFPADGLYQLRAEVKAAGGGTYGSRLQDIDVSIDGQRVALLHYEKGMDVSIRGADYSKDFVKTDFLSIPAGQHKISMAWIRNEEGPYEDLVKPNLWSGASNATGSSGSTETPQLEALAVVGPSKVTGISDNATRRIVFSCKPASAAQERPCAESIVARLGRMAYREPLTSQDVQSVMQLYDKGASAQGGGFEEGVRMALEGILSSPRFVFRIESQPANVTPGQDYLLSDYDMASRLSFFLWGTIPDDALLTAAQQHKLTDKKGLDKEVQRMLADPRAPTDLANRFAAQWLRLQDLDKVHPDKFFFPDYSEQITSLMHKETLAFFEDMVRNDRSMLTLYSANYTFLNGQLADFYGIPNVSGDIFRKVDYPDSTRRGIFGQGSYLVQTSIGNRTSPVLRGKWVMAVAIGAPPPPPPPFVPDLEQTSGSKDGKAITTRERMEMHRANPTCKACHQYIDPLGLAADNFDVTGRYRTRENLALLDTHGTMYDGTPITSESDLVNALLKRPIPLVRTFTQNLMAYATGRRMEDADQPAVREIAKEAEANGYKLSSFIMGVVNSEAFRYRRADAVAADGEKDKQR
jgi:hypothetical protein